MPEYNKRVTGKWLKEQRQEDKDEGYPFSFYCSVCGKRCYTAYYENGQRDLVPTKICFSCGEKMEAIDACSDCKHYDKSKKSTCNLIENTPSGDYISGLCDYEPITGGGEDDENH